MTTGSFPQSTVSTRPPHRKYNCANFETSASVRLLDNVRVLGESRLETRKAGAAWTVSSHSMGRLRKVLGR